MKWIFKPKPKQENPKSGIFLHGLQVLYRRLQSGWAVWMANRTKDFSQSFLKLLLAVFVLSAGSYSFYLGVHALTGKGRGAFHITPIQQPRHATETGEVRPTYPRVTAQEHERIKRFRLYMDSLTSSPTGKALYDSILSHRPGLMDSVVFMDNYYQQIKKQ